MPKRKAAKTKPVRRRKSVTAKKTKKVVVKKKKILRKKIIARKKATPRVKVVRNESLARGAQHHRPGALRKFTANPILEPIIENGWESKATFNPAAVYVDGRVHLLYRAVGDSDTSVLGYAAASDGIAIDERHPEPAFRSIRNPREHATPINYASGGGWDGGCEDPRLTVINDRIYLIYTAFNGWDSLRIALTSIALPDFLAKRWHWTQPVYISPPNQIHKNWTIFPEKINGKFAFLHSISPKIGIAYMDTLEAFDGNTFIESKYHKQPIKKSALKRWDNWIRGAGPPPIKTKYGWLLLYHAMDHKDPNRYKLGAMLLDLKNPTKILHRSAKPILEPDEWYENHGFKWGVVYACGAVVVDNDLIIYYGGADKVVCAASTSLEHFMKDLMQDATPTLKAIPLTSKKRASR